MFRLKVTGGTQSEVGAMKSAAQSTYPQTFVRNGGRLSIWS